MKTTFKQFLVEGGAATAALNTERANKQDMEAALTFVAKITGVSYADLADNLLGSTSHTLAGKRKDSGDIDIAFEEGKHDRNVLVEKMRVATGMDKIHQTGAGVFSFAVPAAKGKKVQVDFMFVPSAKWAKFGFHSSAESKHKGVTRTLLLVNTMKQIYQPGKDLEIKDTNGNTIARVRRSFKPDTGLERLFNLAPMRKDGKGRTALKKVLPAEITAELKRLGHSEKFSSDPDPIRDPQAAMEFMFGKGVTPADADTAEKVIALIKKRKDHVVILTNAAEDLKKKDLPIPAEMQEFA